MRHLSSYTFLTVCVAVSHQVQLFPPVKKSDVETYLKIDGTDLTSASVYGKVHKTILNKLPQSDNACKLVKENPETVSEIFHGMRVNDYFSCGIETVVDDEKIAAYAKDVKSTLPAIQESISVLRKRKALNDHRSDILENLTNVYRNSDGSLLAKAFTALALVDLGGKKLGAKFESLKNSLNLADSFIDASEELDGNRFVVENGNFIVASLATRAIVALSKTSQSQMLTNDQVIKIANFFLHGFSGATDSEKAHIYQALNALNADMTSLGKPISIEKSDNYPKTTLSMTDVFGENVDSCRFAVEINGDNYNLAADGIMDFTKLNLAAGVHEYTVTVSGADSYAGASPPKKYTLKKQSSKVKLASKKLSVNQKGDFEFQENIKSVSLGDKVKIEFSVENDGNVFEAHQSFVRFTQEDREGFAIAKFSNQINVAVVDVDKDSLGLFGGSSGQWKIDIIVGDPAMEAPILESMGTISVKLPGDPEESNLNVIMARFSPSRIIEHVFRAPDSRPPEFISTVFTAITLAPLLLLIVLWGSFGANIQLMKFDLLDLVFHGCLAGVLVLYVLYWLEFNMFQTLNYLFILGAVLAFTGNRLLTNVSRRRIAAKNEEGKKTK